jgi:hypothetical protein
MPRRPGGAGDRVSHLRPRARLQNLTTQSSLDERAAEHGGSAFHLFLTIDIHLFFTIDHSSMWRQRRPFSHEASRVERL